jgi:uncharacterized protein (TIGR02145 family)
MLTFKNLKFKYLLLILFVFFECKNAESPQTSPKVKTNSAIDISFFNATLNGEIIDDGFAAIINRGFVYSYRNINPSVSDTRVESKETGKGFYSVGIEKLIANKRYYYRAYATNFKGTTYGETLTFTTAKFTTTFNEVKSKTGRIWMDRNLGASQVATSPTDEKAYGDLYQWGRGADGHQLRNSESTNSQSNNDESENTLFIISGNFDWRNPKNDNLWQGVNGTNNPCPAGFRIPTEEEWNQERLSWLGKYNSEAAFASPLKLTLGGFRDYNKGHISGMGYGGAYWSSTIFGINSKVLGFNSTFSLITVPDGRADGVSVRCIKD